MARNDRKEPKPMSKSALAKQERDAARALKAQESAAIANAIVEERVICLRAANKVPPSFGEWGYVRTCAWEKVARKLRQVAKRKSPTQQTLDALRAARQMVEAIPTMDIELCAKLVTPTKVSGKQALTKISSKLAGAHA